MAKLTPRVENFIATLLAVSCRARVSDLSGVPDAERAEMLQMYAASHAAEATFNFDGETLTYGGYPEPEPVSAAVFAPPVPVESPSSPDWPASPPVPLADVIPAVLPVEPEAAPAPPMEVATVPEATFEIPVASDLGAIPDFAGIPDLSSIPEIPAMPDVQAPATTASVEPLVTEVAPVEELPAWFFEPEQSVADEPLDPAHAALAEEIASGEPQFVPATPEIAPFEPQFIPGEPEIVPSEPVFIPAEPEIAPFEPQFIPAEPQFIPAEPEIVPPAHFPDLPDIPPASGFPESEDDL